MNKAYSRLKKKMKWLNVRPYTWDDVKAILKREHIRLRVYPMPEQTKGYYVNELRNVYRKKTICINEKTPESERLLVVLHELVHHFLHVTDSKRIIFNWHIARLNDSKEDREANALSLMLAIPQKDLLELSETYFEDINPMLVDKLKQRLDVYEEIDSKFKKI